MKNKWKIGILAGLMISPAAVVMAENPSTTGEQADIDRAIQYFTSLDFTSSMADETFYIELLDKAFSEEKAAYKLLAGKLQYIKDYHANKLLADSLKTEISKLT